MDRLDAFKTIAAQASRGELTFPANVNASLRLQQALNDPDCHVEAAARLIQADPLLAARSVAIANSVAYNRSGTEISSVRAAVQRLGIRTLQSLVAAVIVRQIGSQVTEPALAAKINQLWEHTAHVAALSQVIARRVTHVDPDTALFAGIMHEVAGFYMLASAGDYPAVMDGEPEDWVEHGELEIGRGVMTHLGVPDGVFKAIESMWVGLRALPPETLGDTLLLANHLTPVKSPLQEPQRDLPPHSDSAIDLFIDEQKLASMLEEAKRDAAEMSAALLV